MVPTASPIHAVGDLAGVRLGVAGGPLDKSWLLLQAMARRTAGLDLTSVTKPAYGAPPLLSQKLEAGELDAALLFWTSCARLDAQRFRRVLGVDEIAKALGAEGAISFLGYVFDRVRLGERRAALAPFMTAVTSAKTHLGANEVDWQPLRPLMQAGDEATFAALKRGYIDGMPRRSIAAERAYAIIFDGGGAKRRGGATQLPAGLYWADPA